MGTLEQPIIRGIQAVGSVQVWFHYNGNDGKMYLPTKLMYIGDTKPATQYIDTGSSLPGIEASGYRLDGEFVRASQQISSSAVIPILGGGGVALTNNNRTGSISFTNTKVSTPDPSETAGETGRMYTPSGSAIGVLNGETVFDLAFLATVQQAQLGGDSAGATITVRYDFCNLRTELVFEGCTVASVDPLALSGNDAANYPVVYNYLNWTAQYSGTAT